MSAILWSKFVVRLTVGDVTRTQLDLYILICHWLIYINEKTIFVYRYTTILMDIYWHLYLTGSWITVYPSMFAILKFYIPQMTKFMLSIHTNVQKI